METNQILALIDSEIQKLQRAKALLSGTIKKPKPGKPAKVVKATAPKKLKRSPEVRARMAAAQKARYAKAKLASK